MGHGRPIGTTVETMTGVKVVEEIALVMFVIAVGKLVTLLGNVLKVDVAQIDQEVLRAETHQMDVGVQPQELLLIEASR